ncbi:hypothetical protein HOLleu_03994 [Holothuria leucospilota]|uniref:Uncharacterized protein n=1 Tax=Holothuria leucospilota TaxID=206669 RepID=A0A9Q1CTJ0_HOLLE|nr:hypothetical protein HOLleu_03994 [Holothuria leucospilota]
MKPGIHLGSRCHLKALPNSKNRRVKTPMIIRDVRHPMKRYRHRQDQLFILSTLHHISVMYDFVSKRTKQEVLFVVAAIHSKEFYNWISSHP